MLVAITLVFECLVRFQVPHKRTGSAPLFSVALWTLKPARRRDIWRRSHAPQIDVVGYPRAVKLCFDVHDHAAAVLEQLRDGWPARGNVLLVSDRQDYGDCRLKIDLCHQLNPVHLKGGSCPCDGIVALNDNGGHGIRS
jgi:hypothetical protein